MLNTLKNRPPEEVERLLSDLVMSFLPDPGVRPFLHESKTQANPREQILIEIKSHLGLSTKDYSPEDKAKIIKYLNDEIAKSILSRADKDAVKARLSKLGFNF